MTTKPWFLGACAAACIAGAVGGATMPTSPKQDRSDILDEIPQHEIAMPSAEQARKMIAPRNHYALETPEGRIEVAELSEHGLYRDRHREQPYFFAAAEAGAENLQMIDEQPASFEQPVEPSTTQVAPVQDRQQIVPLEEGIFSDTSGEPLKPVATAPVEIVSGADGQGGARLVRLDAVQPSVN